MKCLNINLPSIKLLLDNFNGNEVTVSKIIDIWDNSHTDESIPTVEEAIEIYNNLLSIPKKDVQTEQDKIIQELEKAEQSKIVTTVEDFFDVTRSRLNKLIKNKNYEKLRELFTTPEGVNRYDSLSSLLKDANKAVEDVEGVKRRVRAIAIGIVQTDTLTDLIAEDVKSIIQNKDNALENISTLQYYLYTLNDWQLFLQDARKTFEDNPITIKTIDSILGKIKAIDANIVQNDISGLIEAFKPLLQPASDKYRQVVQQELDREKNILNNTKNPETTKEFTKRVADLENKLKTYDFSVNENIASFLKGERGDTNLYSYLLEAYSDSPDPITSSFTIWLKNHIQDVNSESNAVERSYEKAIKPFYDILKSRFNPEIIGSQLTFEDNRLDYDGNPFKVVSLLNPFKDYKAEEQKFTNETKALKDLIKNGENVEENTQKLIAKRKEYALWKRDYMNQEFVDEFYDKYELWEDPIGQELKQEVEEIFDQIRQIQLPSLLGERELSQIELDEIDALLKDYKLLGNVNQLDGSPKEGIELKKAQKMQEIRALNNKFFTWLDNLPLFEKAKQRHSEYIISIGIVQDSPEYLKQMELWNENNTRTIIKPEFYEYRNDLIQQINDLFSVLRSNDDNSDFEETWKDIMSITYGHRDEDNQPVGIEIGLKGAQRIKAYQERLEEIKQSLTQTSGLTGVEQNRLSELILKSKDGSITPIEKEELDNLFSKMKNNGLSESSKKQLAKLFEELSQLQSKLPTQYYVDAFNNLSQKYNVTIDNSGLISQDGLPVLESPKLTQLLENEDFKQWFELNHMQVFKFNAQTQTKELKWERLYHWNQIVPNDENYLEVKPSLKYSYRVVKEEFKTKEVVGETIDNKGNYLPKLKGKDDSYINKEYFRLKDSSNPQEKALFGLLKVHIDYLLKAQENLSNRNKLYLDVPRLRKTATERNLKLLNQLKEQPSSIPSTIWTGIKSKLNAQTDYNEDSGNFQAVFADKYGNEFTSIPIKFTGKLDAEDVSLDLFRGIMKYTYSSFLNQKLKDLNPISNALSRVLSQPEYRPKDVSKTIKGRVTENPTGKTNIRLQAIQNITRRVFEGQERKQELGQKVEKVLGLIKYLTIIKTIAFDIPASIANIINAETQNFINASNGYISRINLGKAHSIFFTEFFPAFQKDYFENKIGDESLQSQLFDLFGFVQSHSYSDNIGNKLSQSKIKDALALNWVKNHREWGELFVQSVNAIAYLDATKVQQGSKTISLNQAYELDSDNKITLKEGIDEEWSPTGSKFKELKEKIAIHNNRVHGNYAKGIDKPEAETYTLFSTFIMMKRFFTSMFLNRFASSDVSLTKYGLKSKARYNTRVGAEHGYYLKTLDLFQKELEAKLETGNWTQATPQEKEALVKSVIDVSAFVIAGLLLKYAFGFDPDDEDKYKKIKKNDWLTNQLIYQAARLELETSTFYNPKQYGGFIFDSPIIWGTLKAYMELISNAIGNLTGDPNSYYKKDYGLYKKGESKAKARAFKVLGVEKVLKTGDQDQMVQDYLKMRAR